MHKSDVESNYFSDNLCIEEKSLTYYKDNEVQSCLYVKLKLIT